MRSLVGTTPGPIHHYLNLPRHNDRLARTVQVGSSEQVQYYHKSYLDHVYALTDEGGDALEHIRYCPRSKTRDDQREGFACNESLIAAKLSAFGLPQHCDFSGLKTATSPTGNQFLWNGKRLDPHLGWYVYHYSPELGRGTFVGIPVVVFAFNEEIVHISTSNEDALEYFITDWYESLR